LIGNGLGNDRANGAKPHAAFAKKMSLSLGTARMDKSAFNSEAHKQQLSRIKNGAARWTA
jgi:hypothetical protein